MKEIGGGTFYKVVYSVSDKADLIARTLDSIRSVRNFVSKDDIIVFYTPPRSRKNREKLLKVAIVRELENVTKPFDARTDSRGARRYGEKVHLCEVDFPNVVFLDADTIVKKDLLPLLDGDFDFSARYRQRTNEEFDQNVWERMFETIGKQPIPMFNAGFMIFKNHCQTRLREYWLRYINDSCLPNPHPIVNAREQYALSLALACLGAKIKYMTSEQHAFICDGEKDMETYVVHGRLPPFYRRLRFWIGKKRRSVQSLLFGKTT
jgi:hypothetical protein